MQLHSGVAPSRRRYAGRVASWLKSGTGTMVLVVGLAYAAVAQGSYYPRELWLLALVVALALAITLIGHRFAACEFGVPVVAAGMLALWYCASSAFAHHVRGAVPAVVLLLVLGAAVTIVQRADAHRRDLVLRGALGVGVLLSLTGWSGVAWRQTPRALLDGGLWRAASTITYANATGALLAALSLVAIGGYLIERRRSRGFVLVSYLLVVGLLATASRAGIVSFLVGFLVLVVWTRGRVITATFTVIVGAVVGLSALLPSMSAGQQAQPLLAVIGLVIGAAIALAPVRLVLVATVGVVVAAMFSPAVRDRATHDTASIRADRLTLSSPDRGREFRSAVEAARTHPIVGVGPGRVDLSWNITEFTNVETMHVRYAHDEYLQLVDETGLVGLIIFATGVIAIAITLLRARHANEVVAAAGCTAALVALAVHSATDFLWHIPVVGLTGAVLVGALSSRPPTRQDAVSNRKVST